MNQTLVLFTDYYPYSNTETFLETEIEFLAKSFIKVIICPRKISDQKREVPENIEVFDIFSQSINLNRRQLYGRGIQFIILNFRKLLNLSFFKYFAIPGTFKAIKYTGLISAIKLDIMAFIGRMNFDFEKTVFYTYWLGYETFALGLIKQDGKEIKLISRAHGYDLYDERGEKSLTFIKPLNLRLLACVYCISKHGKDYLAKKYPQTKNKLYLSYLGTKETGFTVEPESNDNFRIVSCSSINTVKRLDRIIDILFHLSGHNLQFKLEWHHLGDGPLKDEIKGLAEMKLEGKIKYYFHGHIENKDVFKYYKQIKPGLFINLSDSEGLPVSIMEAMSAGIPVLATNVGGTPEIVTNDNGWLIETRITNQEIAVLIEEIIKGKTHIIKKKKAFQAWEFKFSADENYRVFAEQIKTI